MAVRWGSRRGHIGAGVNEEIEADISGGVVGIILDGRGRKPFSLSNNSGNRINSLLKWSNELKEYPNEEEAPNV